MERRDFLTTAVVSFGTLGTFAAASRQEALARGDAIRASPGGRLVGAGEVAAVDRVTAEFARADEIQGGRVARAALVDYLNTDVAAYCSGRFARERDRTAMFGAAAATCFLAGFKSADAGLPGAAGRFYRQAYRLARESDPGAHAAYVMRTLAHHLMDVGRPERALDVAEAALRRARGTVDAETESLFWLTLARAHAAGRDRDRAAALRALRAAERALGRARAERRPGWLVLSGPAEARLTNHAAKTLMALGDHAGAETQYARCAALWNPATHRRIHALTLAGVGEARHAQGDLDGACDTWARSIDEIGAVRSARTRKALLGIRAHLSRVPGSGAAELRARTAEALRTTSHGTSHDTSHDTRHDTSHGTGPTTDRTTGPTTGRTTGPKTDRTRGRRTG